MKRIDDMKLGDIAYVYQMDSKVWKAPVTEIRTKAGGRRDFRLDGYWYENLKNDQESSMDKYMEAIVCTSKKELDEVIDCEIISRQNDLARLEVLKHSAL